MRALSESQILYSTLAILALLYTSCAAPEEPTHEIESLEEPGVVQIDPAVMAAGEIVTVPVQTARLPDVLSVTGRVMSLIVKSPTRSA